MRVVVYGTFLCTVSVTFRTTVTGTFLV